MKIAIEAQRIFRPNKHGMDFVALETIRCLQRLDTKNEYFIFTGEGEDRCLEESPNMHITTLRCPSYPLWEQWALPRAVARVKPDLLHCTSNTAPVWGKAPLVLTLHDIIFLEEQAARNKSLYQSLGRIYRRLVVPRILPRCRMVVTVSQFECDRIRTALNFDPGRIMAIHNGYNDRFRPMEGTAETVRKYLQDPEFLFFLGNTDPKKNTPGTLKAYAEYVRRSEKPLPLLVADPGTTRRGDPARDRRTPTARNAPPGGIYPQQRPAGHLQRSFGIPLHLAAREFRHSPARSDGLRHARGDIRGLGDPRGGGPRRHPRRPLPTDGDRRCPAAARNRYGSAQDRSPTASNG